MRALRIISGLVALTATAIAAANWQIDGTGTLIWENEPYAPIGARTTGEPAELDALVAAGITDVIVDLPLSEVRWKAMIEELEKRKLRYLIRLTSTAPSGLGIAVEPQGYRIVNIERPDTVDIELPGAKSALVVIALKNDGTVSQQGRMPVRNGRISVKITSATPESQRVLLVYPEQESIEHLDWWSSFDRHRDGLIGILRSLPTTPGLRGFVNPIGRTFSVPSRNPRFVPNDSYYRAEVARFLEARYRSLESAVRNWGIGNGFVVAEMTSRTSPAKALTTFSDMARLVPLWSGARGVRQFYDPDTSRLYQCDNPRSRAWDDLNEVLSRTQNSRFDHLIRAIRAVRPVPVVQEWNGWSELYDRKSNPLNGIGLRTSGTARSEILQTAARAASTALRWDRSTWIVATDVEVPSDPAEFTSVVEDLRSLGTRAAYLRFPADAKPDTIKSVMAQMKTIGLQAERPRFIPYPENANEPGAPQQLPGGTWWLPTPSSGNRIDLGESWFAYRINTAEGPGLYLWTLKPGRHKLRFIKAQGVLVKTLDGSDPQVKLVKNQIELNIGELPVLLSGTDEIPLPQAALDETLAELASILKINDTKKRDITEELVMFSEYNRGLDRNPGGNYTLMRDMFRRICLKVGEASWIEAESSRTNTFSDNVEIGGCSNGTALVLEPKLGEQGRFFADYSIPSYGSVDLHLWIAAKIPADRRGDVAVNIGTQTLTIQEGPVSPFGQGFAWYKLGVTQTSGAINKLTLNVLQPIGAEFAFDFLYVTPDASFRPRGTRVPLPKPFQAPEKGSDGL